MLTITGPIGAAIALTTGLVSGYQLKKVDDKTKITLKSKLEKLQKDLKLIDKNELAKDKNTMHAQQTIMNYFLTFLK